MLEQMNIVIAGHVDHGKSTIIGRLLADTGSLPEGKLEQVQHLCRVNSKPFEYAFLLDALKDEQSQGITIDSARVFFKTPKRNYIIIDAPGHIEFLKNMVSGASRAEAALLVIDAKEGIQENSRRHGYMLSMLGIKQIAVIVNKMDLIAYDESKYKSITEEYSKFLNEIGMKADVFLPASGISGENIISRNGKMEWYSGSTILDALDNFSKEPPPEGKPFRMPVQDVYKFTQNNDDRRIIAGTIESGRLKSGDEVIFYPSGKTSRVKTIEEFNAPPAGEAGAGNAAGFTLEEQIYVTRGEIAALASEKKPEVAKRIRANIFWLSKQPFEKNRDYIFKLGTAKAFVRLEQVHKLINASDLTSSNSAERLNRHDAAECTLNLNKPFAFDTADQLSSTSRFVIVDNYEISGGGIITAPLEDKLSDVRDKVIRRNLKWQKSKISNELRAEKYSQKSALVLITGPRKSGKKETAKALEAELFAGGRIVYFLGIGNLLYGIDSDIKKNGDNREEHLRRLAEVAHIMLDSGAILIVTAVGLTNDDLEIIRTAVNPDQIETIWTGEEFTSDISFELKVPGKNDVPGSVNRIKEYMQEKGIIFRPW